MLEMKKVHEDKRGEIYVVSGDTMRTPQITILTTKKGYFRGGCIHDIHDEFCVVVEGIVETYTRDKEIIPPTSEAGEGQHMDGCNLKTMIKGVPILIPHGIPHYTYSKTDSVVVVWGAASDEKNKYDDEMRDFVMMRNKLREEKDEDTAIQD